MQRAVGFFLFIYALYSYRLTVHSYVNCNKRWELAAIIINALLVNRQHSILIWRRVQDERHSLHQNIQDVHVPV